MLRNLYFIAIISIYFFSCSNPNSSVQGGSADPDVMEEALATPKESWITERVEDAAERLMQSEAGKLIWESIEAHGGLATWYSQGPIDFHFNYRPRGEGQIRDTYQRVDTWKARAKQELAADKSVSFGWDGENAWKYPANADLPINARFWALTPYYFVSVPFVFSDRGAQLTNEGIASFEDKTYHRVKVTYEEGIGDAPDDYYIAYIDTSTKLMGGLIYIVSYDGFFPGDAHLPEKMLAFDGKQEVNGITLPEAYRTYWWVDNAKGEYITDITLSKVSFQPETVDAYFAIPEGAMVQDSL